MKVLLAIVVFLITALIFHSAILTQYAKFFTINNYTKGADAILILGGCADTRAKKSIELFRDGYADKILITHPASLEFDYKDIMVSDFGNLKNILKYENVEFEVVESINDGAKSTYDEARDLLRYIETNKLKRVIIVTDNFHTRRALLAFNKIIDSDSLQIEIAGAPNDVYDVTNWWKTERGLSAYISEFFKYILYLISNDNIKNIKAT
ncbi:MAG: YdcF family protein [Ichthyobacteriaceae bacterium]|nr:YdcF family protein [Ichthyobacteriaceae bacterium]